MSCPLHYHVFLCAYTFPNTYITFVFDRGCPYCEIAERLKIPRDTIVSYWKPEVAVKLVTDFTNYTENSSTYLQINPIRTYIHTYSL